MRPPGGGALAAAGGGAPGGAPPAPPGAGAAADGARGPLPPGAHRAVHRADAERPVELLDLAVSDAELAHILALPQPGNWPPRSARWAVLEVIEAALYGAAGKTVEAQRVLAAVPRLLLQNPALCHANALALRAGGARARAVLEALLAFQPGPSEPHRDPLAAAEAMVRQGRVVAALRVALAAGAVPLAEEADAHGAAGGGAPPAPARPAPSPAEMVATMFPTARVDVGAEVLADLAALRGQGAARTARGLLPGVDWAAELRRLKPGTAASGDGMKPELLLGALAAGPGAERRLALAVQAYAEALPEFPPESLEIALAARVCFIPKADSTLRPLGVVSVLRRVVAHAGAARVLPTVQGYLVSRGQFGAGAAAGCEALAAFAQAGLSDAKLVALVDRACAYSYMHPDVVLATVQALCPDLTPLVRALLSPARVSGRGFVTFRWRGLFMGCALSPILFALSEEALLEGVRPRLRELAVEAAGFLDDKVLRAPSVDALREAFDLVDAAAARGGQRTNVAKCAVLCTPEAGAAARAAFPATRVVHGTKLVGVPVGDDAYVEAHAAAFVGRAGEAIRALLNRLTAQQAFYLLRCADGWPAVQHVLRGTPCHLSERAARTHDDMKVMAFARLVGEASPAALAAYPLARAIDLPPRLGGQQMPRAERLRGVASAASLVQRRRLLDTAFPPPRAPDAATPPPLILPYYRPRVSGRPTRSAWGVASDRAVECRGSGRCQMDASEGCTRRMCAVCCVLARGGDGGCPQCAAAAGRAAAALEEELPGVGAAARRAVGVSAAAFAAPPEAAWRSFALASAYHQPQRAATCALLGFARDALVADLRRWGCERELRLLEAASDRSAYAWLLAAPLGEFAVTDCVFSTAMRLRMGAAILDPGSVRCALRSGHKPRSCTLHGCARGSADAHALSCKCGGYSIASHNYQRSKLGGKVRAWGIPCGEECHDFLPGGLGVKMDLFAMGAGLCRAPLAVDLTRRFGADAAALAAAERDKETKYATRYEVPVSMFGFAWDELGRVGPQARMAGDLLVAAAARMGAGHHEDLALEFWATHGIAVALANTVRLAHFAYLNNDRTRYAPQQDALAPRGQRRATGASFSLMPRPRVRKAPFSLAAAPAAGRGCRRAASPPASISRSPSPPASLGGEEGAGAEGSERAGSPAPSGCSLLSSVAPPARRASPASSSEGEGVPPAPGAAARPPVDAPPRAGARRPVSPFRPLLRSLPAGLAGVGSVSGSLRSSSASAVSFSRAPRSGGVRLT